MKQYLWIKPLVLCAFIGGVFFRLWFIGLAPQPPNWDQDEYEYYANKIVSAPFFMAAHSYRSYPYPLFVAAVYNGAGKDNRRAVFFLQSVIDSLTGILIFMFLNKLIRSRGPSLIGLMLYEINPFTSGYVGVLLAEVLTAFFIMSTFYCGIQFIRKKSWRWAMLLGLTVGLSAETRNAAFIWAVVPIGLCFFWISLQKYWKLYVSLGIGFFITLLYPLINNWRYYHEINVTTVDSFFAKEFFNGAILKKLPPFTYSYPPQVAQEYGEYYSEFYPDRTWVDRRAMAAKYYRMGWDIVRNNPVDYLKTRVFKMWYVWQKENVFFYWEPGFTNHWFITYSVNVFLLGLTIFGLFRWKSTSQHSAWARWAIIGSIVYATVAFSFTHAEYRLTIPFYPLLYISAAVALGSIWKKHTQL